MPPCKDRHWAQILTFRALAGAVVLGCSAGHDRSAQSATPAPPTTATSTGSTEPAANGSVTELAPASLTLADLDVYEKGAKARVDFMTQLKNEFDAAKTAQDTARAAMRMASDEPDSDGARAAGVSTMHEQQVMRVLGNIISTLHLEELEQFDRQVDTAHMDSAALTQVRPMLAQARQRRDSTTKAVMGSMAPDVAAAFQQRRANLDSLTFQAMTILAGAKKS